eukprot:3932993-Rhodomonas_salina.2
MSTSKRTRLEPRRMNGKAAGDASASLQPQSCSCAVVVEWQSTALQHVKQLTGRHTSQHAERTAPPECALHGSVAPSLGSGLSSQRARVRAGRKCVRGRLSDIPEPSSYDLVPSANATTLAQI